MTNVLDVHESFFILAAFRGFFTLPNERKKLRARPKERRRQSKTHEKVKYANMFLGNFL